VLKKGLYAEHTDPLNKVRKFCQISLFPYVVDLTLEVLLLKLPGDNSEQTEQKLLFYKSSGSGLCTIANLHHIHARFKIGHINLHLVISASNNI
jgi:hypothetical protein